MGIVIVGLGNPGSEYEKTRHNAGRAAVTLFAKKSDFDDFILNKKAVAQVSKGTYVGTNVTLVLPDTMMNASGKAVAAFVKSPRVAKRLLVVHDDIDLPLGIIKMTSGRGSGGHKGVESIMRTIKTKEFVRIRIGVAPVGKKNQAKKLRDEEKVIKLVIGKWKLSEKAVFQKVLKKTVEAIGLFVEKDAVVAMQFANTK